MTRPQRRASRGLIAFWSLLGLLLLGTSAQAHDHRHRHVGTTHAQATTNHHSDDRVSDKAMSDDEHGHHHSDDPLQDLLTLGHNHVGGTSPGLPPTLWILADAPHAPQLAVPWPERTLGESRLDTPFRPPIA